MTTELGFNYKYDIFKRISESKKDNNFKFLSIR